MVRGYFLQWKTLPLYLFFSFSTFLQAQDKVSNYVVVGAFEFEDNAQNWVEFSESKSFEAVYRKNFHSNLFYVYVLKTDNWDEAVAELKKVWKTGFYSDAWIYTGNFGQEYIPLADRNGSASAPEENLEFSPPATKQEGSHASVVPVKVELNDAISEQSQSPEEIREKVVIEMQNVIEEKKEDDVLNLEDFTVFFNLFNSQNYNDIGGEVKIIDAERSKLLQNVKGGEYVSIIDPNNGTGKISLMVENFGYRKMQYDINYNEPFSDTSSVHVDLIGDIMVYNFPLVRYHKGDIVTMYNVYFFKDAAIMRPESQYEVQSLLAMMEENPNYKIKIHGHTNGNGMGKIISAGDDKQFFALTGDDIETFGSAKKLSEERALVIKDYLLSKGISEDRMEIKAWGGKRMIYDKMSNMAKNNVRVEIEILED